MTTTTNTTAASSWAPVDADSPPHTPPPIPPNNTREEKENEEEEEEDEEESVKDYDENYGDYTDDDEIFNEERSASNNGNTRGLSLNLLGPSELSDNDSEKAKESEQEEKSEEEEEVEKEVNGGCGHRFLKLCKQAGSSILGFVGGVAYRIRSKISKKQAIALMALAIATIKAATISSPSDLNDTLEEIAENKTLEERNDDLISDFTNTVIESVVEEFAN